MSKLARKNKDPSNQKGNIRTALAVTAALALGGAALASRDSEPKRPKVTFESNAQAQANLQDLARMYGHGAKISTDEKRDISSAIEGAIPAFKDSVVQDAAHLSSLMANDGGRIKGKTNRVNEGGKQISYQMSTYSKEGVKKISITRWSETDNTLESIDVDFPSEGPAVSYTRGVRSATGSHRSVPGMQVGSDTEHYLHINGDNSLYARKSDSADLQRYGRHDYEVSFDEHFDTNRLGAGRGVEIVAAEMQKVGDMLTGAVAALSAPQQQ